MHEKLIEKLTKAIESLRSSETIGAGKLETLKSETKAAFEAAIRKVSGKINYREELAKRKEQLRKWRTSVLQMVFPVRLKMLLSAPFIYGMIIPAVFLHLCLEIYHQVCFRIYCIPLVQPGRYFVFDRRFLPYLNWFEKLNCIYCEYFNCLLQYAVEIAGRTERYWCPVKHAQKMRSAHAHYDRFVDYLDGENYHTQAENLRDFSDVPGEKLEKCDFMK